MIAQTILTITISLIVISTLTCWGLCWIIASYLHQKPDNYKTILDRFLLDFLFYFLIFNTIANAIIILIRLDYQYGETLALLIQAISTFSSVIFMTWFITTIFVKYVSIFHPSFFADSDNTDGEILVKARFYSTGIAIILFFLEVGVFQNSNQSFIYLKLLAEDGKKSQPGILHLLVFITMISIIYVNLKIKRSGYQEADSKIWLQKIIAMVVCVVLILVSFPVGPGKSQIFQSVISVFLSWTVTLVPALSIVTYNNLRLYLSQKFSCFS